MPSRYHLSDRELADVEFEHRHASDKRYAVRVKTVYLLGKDWPVTKLVEHYRTLVEFKNRPDLATAVCTQPEIDRMLLALLQETDFVSQIL